MRASIDSYFLASYRRHCGVSANQTCECVFDGPDRACDLGWALWRCAHPTQEKPQ